MQVKSQVEQIVANIGDSKADIMLMSSDGKLINAHKLILSKVEYFNTLLYGKLAAKTHCIEFAVPYNVLRRIVEFIYTGHTICVNLDELLDCFKFANEICYKKLETLLIDRISLDTVGVGIDAVINKLLQCKHYNEKLVLSKIKELNWRLKQCTCVLLVLDGRIVQSMMIIRAAPVRQKLSRLNLTYCVIYC